MSWRHLLLSGLGMGILLGSVTVYAQEADAPRLKIGGELRLRSETLVNFGSFVPARTASADDSFVLLRLRPYF